MAHLKVFGNLAAFGAVGVDAAGGPDAVDAIVGIGLVEEGVSTIPLWGRNC